MYIDDDLIEAIRHVAVLEGRSVAAVVRDALRAYLRERARTLPSEPFADLIGAFSSGRGDTVIRQDRYLYGEILAMEHG